MPYRHPARAGSTLAEMTAQTKEKRRCRQEDIEAVAPPPLGLMVYRVDENPLQWSWPEHGSCRVCGRRFRRSSRKYGASRWVAAEIRGPSECGAEESVDLLVRDVSLIADDEVRL